MEGSYRKAKGNAGLGGIQFQVNLVTVFLLNALHKLKGWRISTENQDAAKFDDIVMELSDGRAVFLQAKSKTSRKITKEQLLSTNPKNFDFSLPKYFFSYCEIKIKFDPKAVIICTNADVYRKGLENISDRSSLPPDHPLHYEGSKGSTLTFNENILLELKEQAEIYHERNLQGKGFNKTIITDENLRDFLKIFTIIFNYPSGEKLNTAVDLLLTRFTRHNLLKTVSSQELYKKLEDWFKQERGEYLTEGRANAIFYEIKSDKYCAVLKDHNMFFEGNDFNFKDTRRIYHIPAEYGYLLPTLKIYNSLRHLENKTLYIGPDCDPEEQRLATEAFKTPKYEFLVFVLLKSIDQDKITAMKDILRETFRKQPHKKVILVCKRQFVPNFELECDICDMEGSVSFKELAEETQEILVNRKNIAFQGNNISLKELLQASSPEDYAKAVSSETLEKLVKGEKINVGTQLLNLDEDTSRYYVDRTFERGASKNRDYERSSLDKKQVLTEKTILEVEDKVVLISDTAGMGKTTVLARLAADIKQMNRHIWVIRIELNDYTRILRDFLRKKKEHIQIIEFLNSHCDTKLKNALEKFVFTMDGKIVILLDGFDEISPDYTKLILNLVKNCQEATNIAKTIVTTRPHVSEEVETLLQVKPFVLQPFSRQNQVDFLTSYWTYNLELDDTSRENCETYSDTLIHKMSSWIRKENSLTAIPLQLRILAEIFQENVGPTGWEGCKEFINGSAAIPTLPEKMNITKLYEMFIEKKLDIFIDKANPTGTATSNFFHSNFHQYLVNHQSLALDMIFDSTTICDLFSIYKYNESMEIDILKIGIVQKVSENLDFIHRTFAEYFVAKSIQEISDFEHQTMNRDLKFQQFFIDEILCNPEFVVVRAFLESCLENVVDHLPSDTFDNYKCQPCHDLKSRKYRSELVHILAGEGCVAILQLVLKCINLKTRTHNADIVEESSAKNHIDEGVGKHANENTLDILQRLVDVDGIDIKNENGNTPLHFAAESNHMEMLNFLVKIGATVDIKNKDGIAALHAAAYNGYLDTVKFLVERGADVNVTNKNGTTPLHSAAQDGYVDTVEFLLGCNADIIGNNSGTTPLHLAAQEGHLDTVKVLVKLDTDVNVRNCEGIAPLHLASANGNRNIVKFLTGKGADIQLADNEGFTALHAASQNGHSDLVKFLVDNGADINTQSKNGTLALHSAAINGHLDIIKTFVQHGLDVNIGNSNGSTALHSATLGGHTEVVKFLVEHGADAAVGNQYGLTALHLAAQKGNLDIFRVLMPDCCNEKSKSGTTPLHLAAQNGHLDVVEGLIEVGVDVNVQNDNGFSPLHLAVQEGYLASVRLLFQHEADVNIKSNYGITPLHLAAASGDTDIVKFLVQHEADTNATNDDGFTALHLVVEDGYLNIVELLVDHDTDIDVGTNTGNTALHLAIINSHLDIAKFLVKRNIGVNTRNNYGYTALHMATQRNYLEAIEFLLQHGSADERGGGNEIASLHIAAQNGNLSAVKLLVEAGADVNVADYYGNTPIHESVQCSNFDTISYLVEQGIEVSRRNNYGLTALHVAVAGGSYDFVHFFIKHGLDLNVRDSEGNLPLQETSYTPHSPPFEDETDRKYQVSDEQAALHNAAERGDLDTVQFLVERGVYIESEVDKGCTPLLVAAKCNKPLIVKFLVIFGANANLQDRHGCTPLHYIARYGDLDCVKFLKERDVDITVRNVFGQTPLHYASRWGNLECIKFFIDNGIKIDIEDNEGSTPLHSAARWGDCNCFRYFVDHGVDVNIKDNKGRTPLHFAASKGNLKCVKYLIECEADFEVRDSGGRTPLHSAVTSGDPECIKLFVEHGVDLNVRDNKGYTPMHLAAWLDGLNCMKYLKELGVDVNVKDNVGLTPLHVSAKRGRLDCVKLIVDCGADIDVKDGKGRTPMQLAAQNGYSLTAEYLSECK